MALKRLAYMPLVTYPDPLAEDSVTAVLAAAGALRCELEAVAYSADIPRIASPLGHLLLNIPEMVKSLEESNKAACRDLEDLVRRSGAQDSLKFSIQNFPPAAIAASAAIHARYFDIALMPWARDNAALHEMIQSVVFGSGRPAILVPAAAGQNLLSDVAIAWDGSRVAARALADLLPLLPENAKISVLTVADEKPLAEHDLSGQLAASLARRGLEAEARIVKLNGRPIAAALQETAISAGAGLLAMGAFGHSRLRDFVLGGATRGVLADLRLPVLLTH